MKLIHYIQQNIVIFLSSSLLVIHVTISFIKNINNVNTIFKNGDYVSLTVIKQCLFISNVIPCYFNKSNVCII